MSYKEDEETACKKCDNYPDMLCCRNPDGTCDMFEPKEVKEDKNK